MIARSDALLALPGGIGTCDEPVVWANRRRGAGFVSDEWHRVLRVADDLDGVLDRCAAGAPVTGSVSR